jgi:hypothetical protein
MANPIITLPNSYTRILVAAIASLTLCDAAPVPPGATAPTPAAMEDQIMRIAHPLGLAAGMAVACRQRDVRWYDGARELMMIEAIHDLDTQGAFADDKSGRLLSKAGVERHGLPAKRRP